MSRFRDLLFLLICLLPIRASADYVRSEARIPMRDGVKLYTVIFRPSDHPEALPFIMNRTPYGVRNQNPARGTYYKDLASEGYIFVYQDIRGRFDSEGQFKMTRPQPHLTDPKAIDEATDTYDTIEWLLKNFTPNNGRVGMLGVSYDGTLTVNAAADPHPALRAG